MKKTVLTLCVALASVVFCQAQDKAADLKTLFDVMQSDQMIDAMMDNMIPTLKQQASQQINGDDSQEKYNEYIDFLMEEAKVLSKKLVNEEMVGIYDKYYSHQEIKDLIAFYKSPVGQKTLELTPQITQDLMNAMMNKYLPEFQQKLGKKLESLKE